MVEGMSELTIHCDVAVVGGGPAGLGAARQLRRLGVGHVMVLEREAMAGRHSQALWTPPVRLAGIPSHSDRAEIRLTTCEIG